MNDEIPRTAPLDLAVDPGPTTRLTLTGELDPATAPELDQRVQEILVDETVTRIVLDLGGLTFLDSSGLRVFVTIREALGSRDGELALANPSANVQRLLDITGLGEVITVE